MSKLEVSRRNFLKAAGLAGGGLLLGLNLPAGGKLAAASKDPVLVNTWVYISPDNTFTVLVNHAEMGNGAYTSLPMMFAEEADLAWESIDVTPAPVEPVYFHADWGKYLTGGSSATPSSWRVLREAGAKTRAMMLDAAAAQWDVPAADLSTELGHVLGPRGKKISYGELLPVIEREGIQPRDKVALKSPEDFRLIGTDVKRLEGPDKVDGSAVFGIDVSFPDMRHAAIAHAPVWGGSVKRYDAKKAMKIPGVEKVKQVSTGVAVIARDTWTAMKGVKALDIEWDDGPNTELSSDKFYEEYRELSREPGLLAENNGDAFEALGSAVKRLEAVYEVPYLAHATLEPMCATARVTADSCEVWSGTQFQSNDQELVCELLGMDKPQVTIHRTLMGGGFGRRASTTADFILEAVEAARGEDYPVKVTSSREDDMRSGFYRPLFVHRLRGGLDETGMPVAWHQVAVGQSIMQDTIFESVYMANGIDAYSLDGCVQQPYSIPNHRIESHNPPKVGVIPLWWRSVGQTHTAFAYECFLDELAEAGGQDPMELRLKLTEGHPRMHKVLKALKSQSHWGEPLPQGKARGIAARHAFGSWLAQVAEITVNDDGSFTVDKVDCVIDCGYAINPWNVKAQIEGGIVYGLTAAAYGDIEVKGGRVVQGNFHDYPMMRMKHMPEINVEILPGDGTPTGVGEPGTTPIAPAVANALYAATGKRLRSMPFNKHGLDMA